MVGRRCYPLYSNVCAPPSFFSQVLSDKFGYAVRLLLSLFLSLSLSLSLWIGLDIRHKHDMMGKTKTTTQVLNKKIRRRNMSTNGMQL